MSRAPQFFEVPVGTEPSQCNGRDCRAPIYWIRTAGGRPLPIDCDVDGGHEPTPSEAGQGVAHWGTCANADDFRSRR